MRVRGRIIFLVGLPGALVLAGPARAADCNGNAALDAVDIRSGASADGNENGIPDECEFTPFEVELRTALEGAGVPRALLVADWDGDGKVDILSASPRLRRAGGGGLTGFTNGGDRELERFTVNASLEATAIAAGDTDLDGDMDLFAIDGASLWLARSSGDTPEPPLEVLKADFISSLCVADFNGDGAADAAVTTRPQNSVVLLAGAREGSFGPAAEFAACEFPTAMVPGDFDGDGDLDVAVGGQEPDAIQVLLNDRGMLQAGRRLDPGASRVEHLATADFDRDGRVDLAVAGRSSLAFIAGAPRGDFREAVTFRLGPALPLRSLRAGDFDDDGYADVACSALGAKDAICIRNAGGGSFRAHAPLGLGAPPVALLLADLDGDGDEDLAASGLGKTGLEVLWRGKALQSAGPQPIRLVPRRAYLGFEPHSLAPGDFDRDGDLDLGLIDGETSVILLWNEGRAASFGRSEHSVAHSMEMISLTAADLEGDGDLDIVTADEYTNNVLVLANDGAGGFEQIGSHAAGERPYFVTTCDLNADGRREVLCANEGQNSVSLYLGTSGGRIKASAALRTGSGPMAIAPLDFDRDGAMDAAVACYRSSEVLLLRGNGRGALKVQERLPVQRPIHVIALDADRNGVADLAAASATTRAILLFHGDGRGGFEPAVPATVGAPIHTMVAADLNGDGLPELATANPYAGTVALLENHGMGRFTGAEEYRVGADPRFVVAGDIDGDGDVDLISANHSSLDLTLLTNETISGQAGSKRPYLERVSTEGEFRRISIPAAGGGAGARQTKYIAPAAGGASSLLPPIFQDVSRHPLHQQFLAEVFPDLFPALSQEVYDALTGRRATRKYFTGILRRITTPGGPVYGFDVLADFLDDPAELPTPEEVRTVYQSLSGSFSLRPLAYAPDSREARESAAEWADPGFPVHLDRPRGAGTYHAYTRGVGFGRLRIVREEDFWRRNAEGAFSFQDILCLERAPRDIEGVVGGILTAEPQGELSHLALRTARRGTPNAYVSETLLAFQDLDGKLVRLEVGEGKYEVRDATLSEAQAAWDGARPRMDNLPPVDLSCARLDGLLEMDLSSAPMPPEARYGGKASHFARLQRVLDGPFAKYREPGFAVPVRYYLEFIRSNTIPSARDPARVVTYEEFLSECLEWDAFQTDSRLRYEVLGRFRAHANAESQVDPDLVKRLAARIAEVFGRQDIPVRFRSSSNAEDALEFNGAGLYDSTSACAADDLDGDDEGPCRCDPTKPDERGIATALRRVWASLWNFRAHEERAYYGIPQEATAMAVLVSPAFRDERANGVAFTGDRLQRGDRRHVVTAQTGEVSVVSPDPGVRPEKVLLEVGRGRALKPGSRPAVEIARVEGSTLVQLGEAVLSTEALEELGELLAHIDRTLPVDTGPYRRDEVLLDFEFKIDAGGCLAVKQVRPFLATEGAFPTPEFELAIPAGTQACGVFVPSRGPERSFELKGLIRWAPGRVPLPSGEDSFPAELFEEVRLGPDLVVAEAPGPGRFTVSRSAPAEVMTYRFDYEQSFILPGGEVYELRIVDLETHAWNGVPLAPRIVVDEALLTRGLILQGDMGLTATFSSCTYEMLPAWRIDMRIEGGSSLSLLERHDPPRTPNETGPAALVRAVARLGGEERVVEAYADLAYTSLRHNRSVRYWVLLDPPLRVPGLERPARVLEVRAPEPRFQLAARVALLDRDLAELASPRVVSFVRELAAEPLEPPPFVRGDVDSSGVVDPADAVALLGHILLEHPTPACPDAADADDDGNLTPGDAVMILVHAAVGPEWSLYWPTGVCARDDTADLLGCSSRLSCQ